MVDIYVDADACPVKDETARVAARHDLNTYLVSDGGIHPSQNPLVKLVIVDQGADAADDWIATHIQKADICVTNDIPLAARCLERGALTIRSNGEPFTENSIGLALVPTKAPENGLAQLPDKTVSTVYRHDECP